MASWKQTKSGKDIFELSSAVQKMIRRGQERDAMMFVLEMAHSSQAHYKMVLNRLRVIAQEDIGIANMDVVNFVMLTCNTLESFYEKNGWRIMLGNCVMALCRSPKSREGDHFATVCRLTHAKTGCPPIPDVAYDKHTAKGKRMGRGAEHFIKEGAMLITPRPHEGDRYRDEAEQLWREGEATDSNYEEADDSESSTPTQNQRPGGHLF